MTGHEDAMALVTASLHANQAGLSRLDHELRRDPDRTQAAIAALLSMTLGLLRAYSEEHGVDPGETLAVWGQQMALGAEDTG